MESNWIAEQTRRGIAQFDRAMMEMYPESNAYLQNASNYLDTVGVTCFRYFDQYFKGNGIRVNCLSPGSILANQPADFLAAYNAHCASKGMLAAEDVVGTLLFLLSDESRYMTGHKFFVDDGFSI